MDEAYRVALSPYSIPLIVENGDNTGAVGTGTWISFRGRELIVTAGHVLDDESGVVSATHLGASLGIPTRVSGNDRIVAIDATAAWTTKDADDIDLGFLDITDTHVLEAIRSGGYWKPSEIVRDGVETPPGQYLLLGYPEVLNVARTGRASVPGHFLLLRSRESYAGELPWTAPPRDSPLHGFVDISNCNVTTDLRGISGAPVWYAPDEKLFAVENCVFLGIETAAGASYFRFTRISALHDLLDRLARASATTPVP